MSLLTALTENTSPSLTDLYFGVSDPSGTPDAYKGTIQNLLGGNLASVRGLTMAANEIIYSTGVDTFASAPLTAFARTILDDADASAVRSTLGLAIGTNVQAYNAKLSSIAGLTPASSLIIGNGLGGYEMVTPANFITDNSILDTADIGVSVQAYNSALDLVSSNAYTQFLVGGAFSPSISGGSGLTYNGVLTAGAGFSAFGFLSNPTIVEAASGTHTNLFASAFRGTFTNGAGTATNTATVNISSHVAPDGTTNASTLRVDGAPTGGGGNQYAVHVTSGISYFEGEIVSPHPNHAFGINTAVDYIGVRFRMRVISDGGYNICLGLDVDPDLTGAPGDTNYMAKLNVKGGIVYTQDTDNIDVVAGIHVDEPDIVLGAGASINVAAALYVRSAPTEGIVNASIYVKDGATMLQELEATTADFSSDLTVLGVTELGTTGSPEQLVVNGTGSADGVVVKVVDAGAVGMGVYSASPTYLWYETDGTANQNYMARLVSGVLTFGTQNDALSSFSGKITMNQTGKLGLVASTTSGASVNIPAGSAPTSPSNDDMWFIGDVMYRRIGGVTKSVTFA